MGTVLITAGAAHAAIPEVKRKVKPIGPCMQHFQPSDAALGSTANDIDRFLDT